MRSNLPIGIFDSGVGGLTVLNAIKDLLPNEDLIYLGDTARVPYGTKSAASVMRYAEQAAAALLSREVKLLVIACNTASAVAVEHLQKLNPEIAVVGVVEPGAQASCLATKNNHIGVIATEGTVNNQAYQSAILKRKPDASVTAQACSLFVALAEEGWHEGELVESIIGECLKPLLDSDCQTEMDTLVLGCTHFPVLKESIANIVGDKVSLVDSADTTATVVKSFLSERQLLNEQKAGHVSFLVTDDPARFSRVAKNFYQGDIEQGEIQQVDIQHFS
ncbi:glutamate racemase [Neptuniibacter sp.]|uniref:glutamate racemase n=1 Tax=Neptuniibacter sp. TaxID=1962643 RepID=UPI002616CA0D|nr:glutamate racemase [Neptuniibacter sp.]MCP4598917.1 glutamate racemase [Neptuniibacter sp.]